MNQHRKSAHAVCRLRQSTRIRLMRDVRVHRNSIHSFGLEHTNCRIDRIRPKIRDYNSVVAKPPRAGESNMTGTAGDDRKGQSTAIVCHGSISSKIRGRS
jgi:hypothetical protein